MIHRDLQAKLLELSTKFPIVTVTGPRQSGKSTLLRHTFPDYRYVSLEDPDIRIFAETDPRGFLSNYPDKTIIDEAERVPQLFSYLQTHVDKEDRVGMYMLVGSQNFLLMDSINQSLAGRTAILKLLPFSHHELREGGILPSDFDAEIFTGGYPRIYDRDIYPTDYYPSYIQTYVERDVRRLKNISDLNRFVLFIKLCAGRIGQLFNASSLATEVGVTSITVASWLSVLEASYICYRLQPEYGNISKRLVKTPKLYFYDTGLACSLLGITSPSQLSTHYLRGELYENLVINEFIKHYFNKGQVPALTFWRNSSGNEVDLIDSSDSQIEGYEVKSSCTFSPDFFKGLRTWGESYNVPTEYRHVVYNGQSMATSQGNLINWHDIKI